jgi:sec-independent protein translocase protein TatB
MLDFSWSELLVVLIVAVFVIGPKQIPDILYHLGRLTRRIQYMRFALSKQFDDFMDETELKKIGQDIDHDIKSIPTDFFDEAKADEDLDIELSNEKQQTSNPPAP